MRKLLISLAVFLPVCAEAEALKSFNEVAHSVEKGKKLGFVLNLAQCNMENPPQIIASIRTNAVMNINNNRITTSHRHFTINNPSFPGTAVYEHIKINLTPDNTVSLAFTTLNAADYTVLKSSTVQCQLNSGVKVYD